MVVEMGHTKQVELSLSGTIGSPERNHVELTIDGNKSPTSNKVTLGSLALPSGFNLLEFLEVATIIFLWYISSSLTNNLNKSILDEAVFPFPMTLTLCQFGFIAAFCLLTVYIYPQHFKLQRIGYGFITIVFPLCFSQIVAHLLTQMSLQLVPVSFTHTVKGCSPIFAIALSRFYNFNEKYTWAIFGAVAAIISGVILSSFNEINFNTFGFFTALGSTFVFSWQNTYSKKVFRDKEMDHVNLLFYTSFFACCMLFPVWLAIDLPRIWHYIPSQESTDSTKIISLFLLNGVCHFGQNITAFTFMTRVTPLTYTVFNTFKRTFVIIGAILYFGNAVSFLNATGIALTTLGVALYNKAKLDMRGKH